jgi:uncharacterized protein (TIGR02147 family)
VKDDPTQERRTVFEYNNYREFIRDYYLSSKARNKKFSHRLFARLAGFKSSNFIKFIIDGQSNISEESANKLALAMKLTKEEAHFFRNLVSFNQASTTDERHHFARELVACRTYRKIFPLKEALFNYTSKWYLSVLRGLVGLKAFREDLEWISQNIFPAISEAEIQKGFDELLKLNLLKRDEMGNLVQTSSNISSEDEVALSSVAHFHREMMVRASESIDRVPREKRDISGITIGMSIETAKIIKEKVQKFRREIVEIATQDGNANAVYQFNLQLFPLIELNDLEKRKP